MAWVRACDAWPPPWDAVDVPGGLWWLARLLAYRDMRYAIEHEQPIDESSVVWSAEDGW